MSHTPNYPRIHIPATLKEFNLAHDPFFWFGCQGIFELDTKLCHTENVEKISLLIAKKYSGINMRLVAICANLHDIGRKLQYETIGCFNDRIIDHHYLGAQELDRYVSAKERIYNQKAWAIVRDVIMYHGKQTLWRFAHPESIPYLEIISAADDIENGCLGALGYLEHELEYDAKGYKQSDPERDQRDLNPELLAYLERGEKFDKMALCHTYAEYFVFAAMLAVHSCNQHGDIAKAAMKLAVYDVTEQGDYQLDAVDGYCHLFRRYLHPKDAEIACRIMREKCR